MPRGGESETGIGRMARKSPRSEPLAEDAGVEELLAEPGEADAQNVRVLSEQPSGLGGRPPFEAEFEQPPVVGVQTPDGAGRGVADLHRARRVGLGAVEGS